VSNTEELLMEASEETKATQKEKLTCQRGTTQKHLGRTKLPDHLPIEEIAIHPEGDLSGMVCIGKEIKGVLACVPTKYYIKRSIRYKYAPKNKASKPVIVKDILGVSVNAAILVSKYYYHLPLDRILK